MSSNDENISIHKYEYEEFQKYENEPKYDFIIKASAGLVLYNSPKL